MCGENESSYNQEEWNSYWTGSQVRQKHPGRGEETVKKVLSFNSRDDISRPIAGWKDISSVRVSGVKLTKCKILVLGTLRSLCEQYWKENLSSPSSIGKFCELRPEEKFWLVRRELLWFVFAHIMRTQNISFSMRTSRHQILSKWRIIKHWCYVEYKKEGATSVSVSLWRTVWFSGFINLQFMEDHWPRKHCNANWHNRELHSPADGKTNSSWLYL